MKSYRAIAEFYDAEYASKEMLQHDVPFFLAQLPRRRRFDILELAAGTGRAAIPMAQAGHRVVGIDYARDMIDLAHQKRDAVGLNDRQLKLVVGDVLTMNLKKRFDWICLFFNTFLAFTTLEAQDQLLARVRAHLKPKGRFWIDMFSPDLARLSRRAERNIDAHTFFLPQSGRTVLQTTDIRPVSATRQLREVTFHYLWFDKFGSEKRKKISFEMTHMHIRELTILLERNGLKLERTFGNYDSSPLSDIAPRIIAVARRA